MSKEHKNQVESKTALRTLREAANLTQSQVARYLDKDVSTIRRWERGYEPLLTCYEWIKLCEVLKVNFYDLPKLLSSPMPDSENSQETK